MAQELPMGQSSEPAGHNQVYILGIDERGKPRGVRFTVLRDSIVSAAMDMSYRALIRQPDTVSAVAMKLPIGTVHGAGRRVKLFIPNITWTLYRRVVEAATAAQMEVDGYLEVIIARNTNVPSLQVACVSRGKSTNGSVN
jgi:hypothetical protein